MQEGTVKPNVLAQNYGSHFAIHLHLFPESVKEIIAAKHDIQEVNDDLSLPKYSFFHFM